MPAIVTAQWKINGRPQEAESSIAEQETFAEMTFVAQLSGGTEIELRVAFDPPLAPVRTVIES